MPKVREGYRWGRGAGPWGADRLDCGRMTTRADLHLLRVREDPEAVLEALVAVSRKLTGRDPTPEELTEARRDFGLPEAEPTSPPA